MPFTETWTEELVAEWFIIQNYAVDILLPVSVTEDVGGRFEADVVGVKVNEGRLNIYHVEVGQLSQNPDKAIASLKKKFSPAVQDNLKMYYSGVFGYDEQDIDYSMLYVASYCSRPIIDKAVIDLGLEIKLLDKFLIEDVFPALDCWKNDPISFNPQSCWLLQLVDYMRKKSMLR